MLYKKSSFAIAKEGFFGSVLAAFDYNHTLTLFTKHPKYHSVQQNMN